MIESIDIEILKFINLSRPVFLDGFFRLLTDTAPWIAGLIPLGFMINGLLGKMPSVRLTGYRIAAAYLVAVLVANIFKFTVGRPRPFATYPFIEKLSSGGSGSFPSGHTSDVFAVATALTLLFPRKRFAVPLFVWASAVGYSRLDLGVHYPSDVLGGAMIGAASAWLCHWCFDRRLLTGREA